MDGEGGFLDTRSTPRPRRRRTEERVVSNRNSNRDGRASRRLAEIRDRMDDQPEMCAGRFPAADARCRRILWETLSRELSGAELHETKGRDARNERSLGTSRRRHWQDPIGCGLIGSWSSY